MMDWYIHLEYWLAAMQLILAMVGMGATLTLRDFREVILEPKAVSIGLAVQLVMVPILAFIFIQLFGLTGGIAVGVALIAAIPGGAVSNIFTFFSRGNSALSISITAITTLACLLTTPLILDWLIADYMPASFEMPMGRVAFEIGVCLLLPLLAGMVYLRFFPGTAERFSKYCIRGSLFVIVLIVIGSLGSGRLDFEAFGLQNLLLVNLFLVLLAVVTWLGPRLFGLPRADATAIEMEVIIRSINLGLLIKASLFPAVAGQADALGDHVLFTLLVFGGAQLVVGGSLVFLHRRITMPAAANEA